MAGKVLEVSDGSFDNEVINSPVPVVVDFWAPWCGPCKALTPVIEELAGEYDGRVKFVKINVDEHRKAATRYNVRGIPNLVFFKGGQSQEQIVGAVPKQEIDKALKKLL